MTQQRPKIHFFASYKAYALFIGLAIAIAVTFTNWRSLRTIYYAKSYEWSWQEQGATIGAGHFLTAQQKIHQYFLSRQIYIPQEDISLHSDEPMLFAVRNSCSRGKIYVWIPVKVRLPMFGEKVIEWCLSLP